MKVIVERGGMHYSEEVKVFAAKEDTYTQIRELMYAAAKAHGYKVTPDPDYTEPEMLKRFGKAFFHTPETEYGKSSEIWIQPDKAHAHFVKDGYYRGHELYYYFSWDVKEVKEG